MYRGPAAQTHARSLARAPLARSSLFAFAALLVRSLLALGCSLARSLAHSLARSLACSLACLPYLNACSFACLSARVPACPHARLPACLPARLHVSITSCMKDVRCVRNLLELIIPALVQTFRLALTASVMFKQLDQTCWAPLSLSK